MGSGAARDRRNRSHASNCPKILPRLAANPRVFVRRAGPPRKCARCGRLLDAAGNAHVDNPALDVAIEAGNILGLPVVVYFGVIPNYPNANLRHYHFLQQGLRDVAEDAAERGIGFVVRRAPETLEAFLEEVQAALLIGDENPCREPERWRRVLARRLKIPYWTVDADVVVPSRIFNRSFALLHHFRPHLKAELPKFLVAPTKIDAAPRMEAAPRHSPSFSLDRISPPDSASSTAPSSPSTALPAERTPRSSASRISSATISPATTTNRNHPEIAGTSRLSPYLHFGNIGPLTIALAVEKAGGKDSPETGKNFWSN